jgi:enoyl-CoA hydratase/carnithine racemase
VSAQGPVLTSVADRVGWVVLNRPEQMNAITVELGERLTAALASLGSRDDVHVIGIRGAGGNFSAGGDFAEVQRLRAGGSEALRPLFERFGEACRSIGTLRQPVIAVVEGVAMAGGFELMQAADIALVRDDARLCDNHVNFGQVPGGGGSQRLAPIIGRQRALGHLLSGERLDGRQAAAWGLAYRSYPVDTFEQDVHAFLATMASRRPGALVTIKRLVRQGERVGVDAGLDLELEAVVEHIGGEAGGAGVEQFARKGD